MDRLRNLTEDKIRSEMSKHHPIRPFLCVDNIDFEARVHFKRLENSSRMFHGTWGYLHLLPKYLTDNITQDQSGLPTFLQSMSEAKSKPVEIFTFMGDQDSWSHWHLELKAVILKALVVSAIET